MKIFISAFILFFPFVCTAKAHSKNHLRARQTLETDAGTDVELSTGVTSKAYSVVKDTNITFYVDVKNPATVLCETNGDDGDLELDVSWNSPGQYGCYSSTPTTSSESCSLGVDVGRAYATVYGLSTTSSFTITCTVSEVSLTELKSGVQTGPYELAIGENKVYSMELIDLSTIICEANGSSSIDGMIGVLNLNMRWNNTLQYGCGSGVDSNAVNCVAGPATGRVLITVYAFDSVTDVTIKCTAQKFVATPIKDAELRDGVESGPYNLVMGESFDLFMNVPTFSMIKCETKGSVGDLDLYMKWEKASDYECAATSAFATEKCLLSPNTGIAKINLQGFSTVIGFSITCTAQKYTPSKVDNPELTSGVQSGPYNVLTGESLDFFMDIPTSSIVSCETFGSESDFPIMNGGLTLSMNWKNTAVDGCVSDGYSMMQSCILKPSTGIANINVHGTLSTIGFFVRCTAQEFSPSVIENHELANGVAAGPYNLMMGESFDFYMDVASLSTVNCETSGSSGALDLQMFWGNHPEGGCSSGGGETCALGPNTGKATIRVYGYSTVIGYSISCVTKEISPVKIESAVTSSSYKVGGEDVVVFLLDVPVVSSVQCVLDGDGSNYINFHLSWKNSGGYACFSQGPPTSLVCSVGPGSGEAYVWVDSLEAESNVAVTCTSMPVSTVNITLGVPSGPHTISTGEYFQFIIHNVSPDSEVICQTSADNGDLDLYMNSDGSDIYDCYSTSGASMESCSLVSHSETVFAIAYAFDATEKFTIECTD